MAKKNKNNNNNNENEDQNKNNNNNENENKDEKKNNNNNDINIVLKLHLHCQACISKIRKTLLTFPGVRTVEFEGNEKVKVTASAIVDIQKLKNRVEKKTSKKVDIISPLTKLDNTKQNPKKEDTPKQEPVKTVTLKISYHCHGCGERINKIISSFNGVYEHNFDKEKDQVKVMGKMDPNKLVMELREKLKRPVEILPEKKEKDKEKEKEEKKDNGGGGGGGNGGGGGARIDLSKAWPAYWYGNGIPGSGFDTGSGSGSGSGYDPFYVHPPQYFSDENPNSCSVM